MLQEIMRRGTSTLGADVPSEREINRLAARNEEEFWLFEKMDEERRRRENYRSRLMEEHEVPEWAYYAGGDKSHKPGQEGSSGAHNGLVLGKRQRKEVVYYDTLSDHQWIKAVEEGEEASKKQLAREKGKVERSSSQTSGSDAGEKGEWADGEESAADTWAGDIFSWRAHKRKRSTVRPGV